MWQLMGNRTQSVCLSYWGSNGGAVSDPTAVLPLQLRDRWYEYMDRRGGVGFQPTQRPLGISKYVLPLTGRAWKSRRASRLHPLTRRTLCCAPSRFIHSKRHSPPPPQASSSRPSDAGPCENWRVSHDADRVCERHQLGRRRRYLDLQLPLPCLPALICRQD